MNNYSIIGLDCGATHSKVAIWKNGMKVEEYADWPGMNMDLMIYGNEVEKFQEMLKLIKRFENFTWVIALAGLDNVEEEKEAEAWWRRFLTANGIIFSHLKIISDIELVIWAGSPTGTGIGLISGTGSNCLGKTDDGNHIKVGGMSHLMSDEGSGFSVGWKCLRLVTKMSDGRIPKTSLLNDVLQFYKVKSIADLKNHLLKVINYKSEIAKCNIPLFESAINNDVEAIRIIDEEIDELIEMVSTVNRKISLGNELPLYIAGSLFKNEYFLNSFIKKMISLYPNQKVVNVTPIDGVVNYFVHFFKQHP